MMKTHRMGEMTVKELQDYLKTSKTIILPYGVVEQHGYHLPLDTDIRNAEVMGGKLAEALDCVVAPTLNYCFSGGMLTGTINVKPNTFANLVGEIIESLVLQGFRNIIILPGHGGSESLLHLKESLRILKWLNPSLGDSLILLAQLWDFSPTWRNLFKSHDYHAGKVETSLLKHWCPEVVREKIVMDSPKITERLRSNPDSYQHIESFTDMRQEIIQTSQRKDVKVGVMGYPEKASARLGAKIESEILKNALQAIQTAIRLSDSSRSGCKRIVHTGETELKILSL